MLCAINSHSKQTRDYERAFLNTEALINILDNDIRQAGYDRSLGSEKNARHQFTSMAAHNLLPRQCGGSITPGAAALCGEW